MFIFWRLVLAHLLTDFTFQTNQVAKWKRENVWGGLFHSFLFTITAAVLVWPYLTDIWINFYDGKIILQGWACLILISLSHFLEDEWRIWTITKLNSPDSFYFFIWDQFIHLVLIFSFSPLLPGLIIDWWALGGIIIILSTHFSTIFIYFLEKDIFGKVEVPSGREKYFSMLERVLVTAGLFVGKFGLLLIPLSILIRLLTRYRWHNNGVSWIHIAMNYFLGIVLGFFSRLYYLV
jgi:hypothetical protein